MSIKTRIGSLLLSSLVLLAAPPADAGLDAPHNASTATGCLSCHQMTSTYPKLLPPLNHTPVAGDIDDTVANGACWSCHTSTGGAEDPPYVLTHSSLATGDPDHGQWTVECWVCHNQHLQEQKYNGSTYGKYIRRSINLAHIKDGDGNTFPGKSGTKTVVFKDQTGLNSFADGEGAIDGICEVCHSATTAWQNDGDFANDGAHKGLKARNCMLCHPHTEGFKADYKCLDCHADPANTEANLTRVNVKDQFSGNSHHVQRGGAIENTDCHQCHWEADATGKVTWYHGATPTSTVDLVIYGAGARPDGYTLGSTAIAYTADGSRGQILSLNNHCLGCHDDDSKGVDIFGDGKVPNYYAWDESSAGARDGSSVKARYSRPETTTWGKYSPYVYRNVENKYEQTKAYSAHGNAAVNQRGWYPLAWEAEAAVPDTVYYGADLLYPGTGDFLYGARGNNTTSFYRYSIGSDAWTVMAPTPATISYGADLTAANGYIYALRGNSTQDFYRYSIAGNSWAALASVPGTVQWGGSLVYPGSGDYLYALRGAYTTAFHRYSISTNTWTAMAAAPAIVYYGADLIYPGTGDYLYATRGAGSASLYRYSISTNSWAAMANAPAGFSHGASLASSGTDGYIYAGHAWGQSNFSRYSISGNVWLSLSANPQGFSYGGALAYPAGDYLYALPGNSSSFQRYRIGDLWPDTSGTTQVACFDCHNSHGSSVGDAGNPATSYVSATPSGGILKDTTQNKGGYAVTYTPAAGGSAAEKNEHNPGAGLCFDCHLNAAGATAGLPWGYQTTYAASQAIVGYRDTAGFGNGTFGYQQRYQYKVGASMGGHFGASAGLTGPGASFPINGLCTPCHDPHGVSPSLGANASYGVPLLKGTFMTSPYKEDAAPASTTVFFGGVAGGYGNGSYPAYNIDQNTFADWNWGATTKISENSNQFGGLCLKCHPQSVLNPDAGSSSYDWRSMNRVHNTVKGWGGQGLNAGNAKHAFTCSKCHTVHNSQLPRLMITNCLDSGHRGRVGSGGVAGNSGVITGVGDDGSGSGSGKFPAGGQGSGSGYDGSGSGWSGFGGGFTCHDATNADGWPGNQRWNTVTPWLAPNLTLPTATAITSTTATLGANLTNSGGSAITARGTTWGTAANPTTNALAEGGTALGVFAQARTGLPAGTKIYYSGFATNSNKTGYSPDGSFHTEPATQAAAVNFAAVTSAGMTVSWARGDGDGVIVLMRQGSAVNSGPVDGTYSGYAANPVFGSGTQIGTGNYVVYKGSGTSVAVTGLTFATTYYVAVYEYKGTMDSAGYHQGTNYKPSPATDSQATGASAPILSAPAATAIGDTAATLGATITSDGGAAITARGTVWGTAANPTTNVLAEGGTATGLFTQARSGLPAGSRIYYRGYAINGSGTGYSPDGSFHTEPATQATGVTFTAVGISGLTVNWTRGNGDGVIVLMRQGAAVDAAPADGTYTACTPNSVFTMGTQIGTGNYVVHKGTGTSVTITGLTGGTTYHVAIHEYQGTADTAGVNQGTNYKAAPATSSQATNPGSSPSQTFNYTGSVQTFAIPAGALNIQFTVKGAGGGGGRNDDVGNEEDGQPGHLAVTTYATAGITVDIYVGGGGQPGSINSSGAPGGWGYVAGGTGSNGDDDGGYCDDWAYGGAGGGGSSAIVFGGSPLAQAAGGAGGRSSDWTGICNYMTGGAGGSGGGSDYPATTSPTGGSSGGSSSSPTAGGNGQVTITYDLP